MKCFRCGEVSQFSDYKIQETANKRHRAVGTCPSEKCKTHPKGPGSASRFYSLKPREGAK